MSVRFRPYTRRWNVGVLPETRVPVVERRGGRRLNADLTIGVTRVPNLGDGRSAMYPVSTRAQKPNVGVRDVTTFHEFFGKRLEFNRGEMLLLYNGQDKMSTAVPQPTNPYELPQPCNNPNLGKRTVPLAQLQSMIDEEVTLETNEDFDFDAPYSEYVKTVCARRGFDSFGSVLARMQSPRDFNAYFQPIGYQLSYGGQDAYSGDAFPCITTQHCGRMIATLSGAHETSREARAGTKVYLVVGMRKCDGPTVLNHPYPTLLFCDDRRQLHERMKIANYVCLTRSGRVTPCMVKAIGEFVSDYRGRNRSPELELFMKTDFEAHHFEY